MSIPIISFYSYKGGSGRTTTAINTVTHLAHELKASPDNPLLVVDFDVESAGMTYFFNLSERFFSGSYIDKDGIILSSLDTINTVNLLNTSQFLEMWKARYLFEKKIYTNNINKNDLYKLKTMADEFKINLSFCEGIEAEVEVIDMFIKYWSFLINQRKDFINHINNRLGYGKGKDSDTLKDYVTEFFSDLNDAMIVSGGKAAGELLKKMLPTTSLIDISSNFSLSSGTIKFLGIDDSYSTSLKTQESGEALDKLNDQCERAGFCGIVLDSSSGRQASAEIIHQKSNVIVYCMRPTTQFRRGTEHNLQYYYDMLYDSHIEIDSPPPKIILLPAAVPLRKYDDYTDMIFSGINEMAAFYNRRVKIIDDYFCSFDTALCEIDKFKWIEDILCEKTLKTDDEKRAYSTFGTLALRIASMLKE